VIGELLAFKSATGYWVVNVPVDEALIWFPLTVNPSQPVVASWGRLAMVPPGSEHSMICTPVGGRPVNPVPVTVIVWPSLKGPLGMVTVWPCA
jgi:hypothetical protein